MKVRFETENKGRATKPSGIFAGEADGLLWGLTKSGDDVELFWGMGLPIGDGV